MGHRPNFLRTEKPGIIRRIPRPNAKSGFKLEVQLLLALERKHWSYDDLAKAIGTQKGHISRDLKGGGIQTASVARVSRIAEALGMKFLPLCISRDKLKGILPKIEKLVTA